MAIVNAISSVGSCMAFSAVLPATETEADYAALTWLDWEGITQYGDLGTTDDVTKVTPVCTGIAQKIHGSRDNGTQDAEALYDSSHPAQIMVRDAYKNRTRLAVRMTLANGDVIYYLAIVTGMPIAIGGADDNLMANPTFDISGELVEVIAP